MILRSLGAETLSRWMAEAEPVSSDLSWLLFGPTDPAVIAPEPVEPLPLAAE